MKNAFPPVEKKHKKKDTAGTKTICWDSDSKFPTIRGKWKRLPDGRILATYTPDELEDCSQVHEAMIADEVET